MVVVKPVRGGRRLEITRKKNCNLRRKMTILVGVRHTSSKCLILYRINNAASEGNRTQQLKRGKYGTGEGEGC